jgi:hypothetical protein
MNREDIIRMALEAEVLSKYESPTGFCAEAAVNFAALVASAEREACAQIAEYKLDNKGLTAPDSPKEWWNYACQNIRDAIRARGQA